MGIRYIHLVRHGQYNMDETTNNYGRLNRLGRYQARRVGARLAQHPISTVYVSTMPRAQETGELIFSQLDHPTFKKCELLVEGIPDFPKKLIREKKLKVSRLKKTKTRMNKAFKKYFIPFKGKGEKHEALICMEISFGIFLLRLWG